MTLLQAVNTMLRSIGESPVAALNSAHPLIADLLDSLEQTSIVVQSRGWWFNTFERHVAPASPGADVVLPAGTSFAQTTNRRYGIDVYVLNGELVNKETGDVVNFPLDLYLRTHVAWDSLPETAAQYITARAAFEYATDYDADSMKLQTLKSKMDMRYVMFNTEHIRAVRTNRLLSGSTGARLAQIFGDKYVV